MRMAIGSKKREGKKKKGHVATLLVILDSARYRGGRRKLEGWKRARTREKEENRPRAFSSPSSQLMKKGEFRRESGEAENRIEKKGNTVTMIEIFTADKGKKAQPQSASAPTSPLSQWFTYCKRGGEKKHAQATTTIRFASRGERAGKKKKEKTKKGKEDSCYSVPGVVSGCRSIVGMGPGCWVADG